MVYDAVFVDERRPGEIAGSHFSTAQLLERLIVVFEQVRLTLCTPANTAMFEICRYNTCEDAGANRIDMAPGPTGSQTAVDRIVHGTTRANATDVRLAECQLNSDAATGIKGGQVAIDFQLTMDLGRHTLYYLDYILGIL